MRGRRLAGLLSAWIAAAAACDGPAGSSGAGGADGGAAGPRARAPQAEPLRAVFTPENFTTVYTASVSNPDMDTLAFAWGGPNCGPWFPETVTCNTATCTSKLTWQHPHPPCSEGTQHADVTILFQAVGQRSGRTVVCPYRGSESGTGTACYQNGFGASEVGPDTNFARVRYHLPFGRQCSKIDLVQVIWIVKKGPPDVIVVPHNDGMIDPGGNMLGYQLPAREDDANGYVVDKFKNDFTSNDPFYPGAVPGTATTDAELDDRPDNTRPGHRSHYEVCAFCSAAPTDADYGKYLDCYTWELDGDTRHARETTPQPTERPTRGFTGAVEKWNQNKGFTMPARR